MKAVATVMAYTPVLTLKLGLGYLGLRKQAHKSAKLFRDGLVTAGMPSDLASELAEAYEADLSITRMMKSAGVSFPRRKEEKAPGK